MNTKSVSIYIPAYNAEKTIEDVLNRIPVSLQKEFNAEILVIDDASKDDTYKIGLSHKNKSISKLKEEIKVDFIPPITAVAALGQLSPSGEIRQLAAPISQFGSSPRVIEILVNQGDFVN